MSCLSSSSVPGVVSPAVIRTLAMRASSNVMPKNDKPPSPGEAGTKLLNNSRPSIPKNSEKHVKWCYGSRRSVIRAASIPIDLTSTGRERPRRVQVIWVTQCSAKRINRALNCGRIWTTSLKHSWRCKISRSGTMSMAPFDVSYSAPISITSQSDR